MRMIMLTDATCKKCGADALCKGTKDEPTIAKVFVRCDECGHDFGMVGTIKKDNVDGPDEISDRSAEMARKRAGA
ncbi:hypothetical protein [Halorhabdus rudnickae]|uniref:hypothetical protein n=1 Tax=Halorhabdus rudnickae TaxID=1775544 RepID=UPI00108349C9|nr:hypothetical protein [Halorhabdus rudnickae]